MKFLEIIEKKINLDRNNIELTLLDTNITQFTKLIAALPDDLILTDDLNEETLSESLMLNIKYRQDKMNEVLENAETEATSLSIPLSYTSEFLTLSSAILSTDERIDNDLLILIVNNEIDLYKRFQQIKEGYQDKGIQLLQTNTNEQFLKIPKLSKNIIYDYNITDSKFTLEDHHNYIKNIIPLQYFDNEYLDYDSMYNVFDNYLANYINTDEYIEQNLSINYNALISRLNIDLDYKIEGSY